MRRRGPLAGSCPAAVALVGCALMPFLMLTAAVLPLLPLVSKNLLVADAWHGDGHRQEEAAALDLSNARWPLLSSSPGQTSWVAGLQ